MLPTTHVLKMAKSLRSKRKRKFRAIKRMRLKPKLDAKLREIAIRASDEKMVSEENSTKDNSLESKDADCIVEDHKEVDEAIVEEDIDMDGSEDNARKKSSGKNAKVPLHLLSQRKLRKLQLKQKQKKLKKTKKFLKW